MDSHKQISLFDTIWFKLRTFPFHAGEVYREIKAKPVIAAWQTAFDEILMEKQPPCRPWIFASGLSWDKQLFQRPQQLALALAKQGQLVFYLEPGSSLSRQTVTELEENLYWVDLPAAVLSRLPSPYIYLLPWSYAPRIQFQNTDVIYDLVDDFSTFKVDPGVMKWQHAQRIAEACMVLASSQRLVNEFRPARSDLIYCPNGVDPDFIRKAAPMLPADILPILADQKPVAGYVGALAEWFDYGLMRRVAEICPQVNFVLIGPAIGDSLNQSGLLALENIHWLGPKPYAEIPDYLSAFDAGLIPFILNDITHAASPLKLFEYMAAGKPVVITPMQESLSIPGVLAAATADEFAQQLQYAIQSGNDSAYLDLISSVTQDNTWDARARQIIQALGMV